MRSYYYSLMVFPILVLLGCTQVMHDFNDARILIGGRSTKEARKTIQPTEHAIAKTMADWDHESIDKYDRQWAHTILQELKTKGYFAIGFDNLKGKTVYFHYRMNGQGNIEFLRSTKQYGDWLLGG